MRKKIAKNIAFLFHKEYKQMQKEIASSKENLKILIEEPNSEKSAKIVEAYFLEKSLKKEEILNDSITNKLMKENEKRNI